MPSFRSRAKTTPQNLDDDTDESEFSDIEVCEYNIKIPIFHLLQNFNKIQVISRDKPELIF